MSILLVLLTLVLGFKYAEAVPYEKVKLKRSDGWEAYVYLAKHGLFFLIAAVIIVTAALFMFFVIEELLLPNGKTLYLDITYKDISFSELNANNLGILGAIVLTSLFVCSRMALFKKSADWRTELRKEDSILSLLVEAVDKLEAVKISLKSRKVYIGLIEPDQFEISDLENIVIIPYMSGYRDKDKLRLEFDCNYISVYVKNDLLSTKNLNKTHMKNINDFRLAIRMDEIESISLFDPAYYEQFEFEEVKDSTST